MRIVLFYLCLFFSVNFIYSDVNLSDVNTILVIIEETENGKMENSEYSISDGIFETLWNYNQFIFFDMKLNDRIKMNNNELDAKDYLEITKSSGADSILLIKVDYSTMQKDSHLSILVKDFIYKFIHLKDSKLIKKGKEDLNVSEEIETKNKNQVLRSVGEKIIKKIFE